MRRISKSSIASKLKAIIVLVTTVVLIIAATLIVFNQYRNLRDDLIFNSSLSAKLISEYCITALMFSDPEGCVDLLSKSKHINYIIDMTIYDTSKVEFAKYINKNKAVEKYRYKKPIITDTVFVSGNIVNVVMAINWDYQKYGYMHLRSSMKLVNQKINTYLVMIAGLLLITIFIAYIIGSNIQKIISNPILKLAELTNQITASGDYSRKLNVKSNDEIGILYQEFNRMLHEINQKNLERDQKEQEIKQLNEELEEKVLIRTQELQLEKEKTSELLSVSDQLLLNILPGPIAARLKRGEKTIADHYDDASVVFIDIVDFTKKSAASDPKRVVEVLNELYSRLDNLANKHGLEKIKTIGDCYMAAAGVPHYNKDNAIMAAKFAIEAMNEISNYDTGDGTIINFRCGIDGGPMIAGIIGENKFIYDLWGDTVNTAARMEEYGEPGKIHVTKRFTEKLEKCKQDMKIQISERGEIEIKGKGKMQTFFIERDTSQWSDKCT